MIIINNFFVLTNKYKNIKMKKSIFNLAVVTCIAGTLLVSCKPATTEEKESQEKVEIARDNLDDAKDSLAVARKEATKQELEAFRNSGDSIIRINNLKIAGLKLKMKETGKSIDATYQKNIDILEQKNENLQVKMDTFKNDAKSDWQSFKREFKHDTDEIGNALKDLTVNNKK
jgi:hypothetical protein